jgi:hypothetical protein
MLVGAASKIPQPVVYDSGQKHLINRAIVGKTCPRRDALNRLLVSGVKV